MIVFFKYIKVCHSLSRIMVCIIALMCTVCTSVDAGQPIPSHCLAQERVIFSCKLRLTDEVLSLCSDGSVGDKITYLQYRFGKPGKADLHFPAYLADSLQSFKLMHYFRADVDRRELRFTHDDTNYVVFAYVEGEERPAQESAGVAVKVRSTRERKFWCEDPYSDRLRELEGVVAPAEDTL